MKTLHADWLDKKINIRDNDRIKKILTDLKINTICTEALCPNISECHRNKQATFLILGKICTRSCSFCNVDKGIPIPPCPDEPERIVKAVKRLGLDHVVITSPTRDDLPDCGAGAFVAAILALKRNNDKLKIEVLIPDLSGKKEDIETIVNARPDIIGHNIETVSRLYRIRSGSDYSRSLNVLKSVKSFNTDMKIKSALILGLGETEQEVTKTFDDLIENGCRYLSIGQYLAPGRNHYPVKEYVHPDKFSFYRQHALLKGFVHVESGPYVRSSYHADSYLKTEVSG